MPGAGFSVTVTLDSGPVQAALSEMGNRCRSQRPVWSAMRGRMHESMLRNFRAEGRPDRWPPLAWATLHGRIAQGHNGNTHRVFGKRGGFTARANRILSGHKILVRSGRLRNSVVERSDATGMEQGANLVYAAIHQYGGKAGRGRKVTIPARPYLEFQPDDIAYAEGLLLKHVTDPMAGSRRIRGPLVAR